MRRLRAVLVLAGVGFTLWSGSSAHAACHAFTLSRATSVTEGGKVTIRVERDGTAADSSVRVQTVDRTARAPGDFTAVDQRVTFTDDETSKTVTIQTREDRAPENTEGFQVKVSDAQGCTPNSEFEYDDPTTVAIVDDDERATPVRTARPRPTSTTVIRTGIPTSTPSPSPTPTPSATPSASPTTSPPDIPTSTPAITEDEGGFPWVPVLAVVGFLAAAGGALMLVRMRGGGL